MTHDFDKNYWEEHWRPTADGSGGGLPVNPYLPAEVAHLPVGAALDAGCGTGTEALWLAAQGWQTTGADIAAPALSVAARRAEAAGLGDRVTWIEADLTRWEPGRTWDLVVTSYAHPDTGQLAFYARIASWVAPGGTLLIVGHLPSDGHGTGLARGHDHAHGVGPAPAVVPVHGHAHGDGPAGGQAHPEDATATRDQITALFTDPEWRIDAAYEHTRTIDRMTLRDVVIRAQRLR